ncbi:ankyrin repeat-containing protein [Besnoitia besnoiti]|uniref:Ankyrin repeat-containing protein n=1 Tax=Besnoitia besnoiti TaxID=94643 RepID=A0A2A9MBI9_BESBE|nr:ankyrin repeat-containing protein [Besnoitia besnoiti]PFH33286.1 ankyrin repeat-containing protein [Besnoitia besnoiti]
MEGPSTVGSPATPFGQASVAPAALSAAEAGEALRREEESEMMMDMEMAPASSASQETAPSALLSAPGGASAVGAADQLGGAVNGNSAAAVREAAGTGLVEAGGLVAPPGDACEGEEGAMEEVEHPEETQQGGQRMDAAAGGEGGAPDAQVGSLGGVGAAARQEGEQAREGAGLGDRRDEVTESQGGERRNEEELAAAGGQQGAGVPQQLPSESKKREEADTGTKANFAASGLEAEEEVDAEVAARAVEAVDIAVAAGAVNLRAGSGRAPSIPAASAHPHPSAATMKDIFAGAGGGSGGEGYFAQGANAAAGGGGGSSSAGRGGISKEKSGGARKKTSPPTPNDVWKDRLKLLEGFLDVESILLLKQCARVFYRHKYKPHDGILRFHNFRGYDPKVVMETILPLASRSIHPAIRERGLTLDFSHCTLMKDVSVARLMDAVHGEKEENQILGNLKALCLDFCYEITDKGLSAMLTTYLPHLERVSVRCARSTELTFVSVMNHLSSERWPKLIYFDASFTNIWLEAATAIADQLFMNAARLTALHREEEEHRRAQEAADKEEKTRQRLLQTAAAEAANDADFPLAEHAVAEEGEDAPAPQGEGQRIGGGPAASEPKAVAGAQFPASPLEADMQCVEEGRGSSAEGQLAPGERDSRLQSGRDCRASGGSDFFVTPSLEITGSVASKSLLLKVGMESHYRAFCQAVKTGDWETVSLVTKRIQKELSALAATTPYNSSRLILLQQFRGSELLVNAPFTVETTEEGGVNVLTLPISIAIQRTDTEMLGVLLKRGAQIEVCDYLGKSPLYRACEVGRRDIVETLLVGYGASPEPADVRSELFPLHTAVKKQDVQIVKLLLKRGASLDLKCPAVKSYKSALFVACEVNAPEIIQLCLEAGADPNWKGHNSYTPTLLAYQLNSAWLPHFLDAGAGNAKNRRWVLTEVLSCAIAKNDLVAVELLVRKFPDLLARNHQLWSRPLIQAAKQGKADIISALLAAGSAVDVKKEDGQTPLLAAAEEDFVVCVQLLLDAGADINGANNAGLSALHLACTENRTEVVKLLLNRGCDVNIGDKANGETPLMMCIRMRNEKMAVQILELGKNLDLEKKDHQGSTALLYAMFFGQYLVAGMLMDRGADVTVSDLAGNSAYAIVNERLMTQGADKRVLRKFLRLYKSAREGKRPRAVAGLLTDAAPADDSAASGADSGPDGGGAGRSSRRETSRTSRRKITLSMVGSTVGTMGSSVSSAILSSGNASTRTSILSSGVRTPPADADSQASRGFGASAAAVAEDASGPRGMQSAAEGQDMDVDEEDRGAAARAKSSARGGKKLKLEPKSVLQVAKLPIALFRAAKAK